MALRYYLVEKPSSSYQLVRGFEIGEQDGNITLSLKYDEYISDSLNFPLSFLDQETGKQWKLYDVYDKDVFIIAEYQMIANYGIE